MSAAEVIARYGKAMAEGDMVALAATFASDVVWHQPGNNPQSGDHRGVDAVMAHLGGFMHRSAGTFALVPLSVADAGNLVSMTVRFTAQRDGRADLDMHGVDVFRVAGDTIAEVWLISEDQAVEDEFWND